MCGGGHFSISQLKSSIACVYHGSHLSSPFSHPSVPAAPSCGGLTSGSFSPQGYVVCPSEQRFMLLFTFLKKNLTKKIMVFLSSCNSVRYHAELLNYIDVPVLDIHVSLPVLDIHVSVPVLDIHVSVPVLDIHVVYQYWISM